MHHWILLPLLLSAVVGGLHAETAPWRHNLATSFAYALDEVTGAAAHEQENGQPELRGTGAFSFTLEPQIGGKWNMSSVSVLGLMVKNAGPTEISLEIMVGGVGATVWENSAIARAIVHPGEEAPLGVIFYRALATTRDPDYQKMIGRPNGHRGHWQHLQVDDVRRIEISGQADGAFTLELGALFPYQRMDEQYVGIFPFIDQYGQYTHHDWEGKIKTAEDFEHSRALDHALEKELGRPTGYSRYGGWQEGPQFEATGFFRTVQHDGRWWFVDPEGNLFWSYGVTCVGEDHSGITPIREDLRAFEGLPARDDPEFGQFFIELEVDAHFHDVPPVALHYDYGRANLFRKHGPDWERRNVERTIRRLQYSQLNTIAAWSDTNIVKERKVPYTAMVHPDYPFAADKLPDPFDPAMRAGLRQALRDYPVDFRGDPWCLGVFVNNELHWTGSNHEMVASVLGFRHPGTAAKRVFRDWLREKYKTVEALNAAWSLELESWEALLTMSDPEAFAKADRADCAELLVLFADAYFKTVDEELEAFSPDHLYLGCRFHMGSAELIATAARYVDVISANIYLYRPNVGAYAAPGKPVIISEFHFTKVEGKNLGGGLRSAVDATQQARLFRQYMKEAVDDQSIVGAHWFQWKDQSVGGRWDGENYDLGFFDVTDHPNETLIRTAAEFGRVLYTSVPKD